MSKPDSIARLIGSILATLFIGAILSLAFCTQTDRYKSVKKVAPATKEVTLNSDGYNFYVVDASLHKPDDRGRIMQWFFENHNNVTEYTVYVTRKGELTRIVGIRYK